MNATPLPGTTHKAWSLILVGIMLTASLPKGGMVDWFPLVFSTLLVLALFLFEFQPTNRPLSERPWLMVWLMFSIVTLAHLFIVPRFVSWNSPLNTPIGSENNAVNLPATINAFVLFTGYWLLAFLASQLTKKQISLCLLAIVLAVIFQITYGLVGTFIKQESILGIWPKRYYLGSATGSFVNHNHYPNFLAVACPLASIYLLKRQQSMTDWKHRVSGLFIIAAFSSAYLCALIFSNSRMGVAIGVLALFGVALIGLTHYRPSTIYIRLLALSSIVVLCFSLINFIGVDGLLARYQRVFGHDMRWDIWPATLSLPLSMWVFGSGGGTFFDVFLGAHPAWINRTVYYAHNDYIQLFIEYGAIGVVMLGATIIKLINSLRPKKLALPHKLAVLSILLMAIHALVDFSMHIPANAILFWFAFGVALNNNLTNSPNRS